MCGPEELKSTKTIDLLVWRLQLQLSVNTNVNVTSQELNVKEVLLANPSVVLLLVLTLSTLMALNVSHL